MENLLKEFQKIYLKKWIKGVNDNNSSVGLTFEWLLNKTFDTDIFPDYKDIEIKCTQRFSNYPLHLFNQAFDGPNLYETNYILEKYGTLYNNISDKKYLFVNLLPNCYVSVNEKYYFLLTLSYIEKKVYIKIYDLNYNLLDSPYIDFETINNHLKIKLNSLALIYASKKEENSAKYFRYYAINFYKLKSLENFYKLIEKGIIRLSIVCRASFNNGVEKQKNKSITFRIAKKDITKLYDKILEYDADNKNIILNSDYYFKN